MELQLVKRYRLQATRAQAWVVLGDLRVTAACMPGAEITEQLDDTHFKGQVRTRIGPATMAFQGEIELLERDEAAQHLRLLAKGADRGGSAASMALDAHLEEDDGACVLVGTATVKVSGKLAQIGNRLLQPASDALLGQFAERFDAVALAVPLAAAASADDALDASAAPRPGAAAPAHALQLLWLTLKTWLSNGGRR